MLEPGYLPKEIWLTIVEHICDMYSSRSGFHMSWFYLQDYYHWIREDIFILRRLMMTNKYLYAIITEFLDATTRPSALSRIEDLKAIPDQVKHPWPS